ncbi:MAG: hypothetical protein EOP04_14200 [Proteobacteria bacterium]|nr:MAG: hypothetical protein EOP04_14200 [Pseudomonadota bacterium]
MKKDLKIKDALGVGSYSALIYYLFPMKYGRFRKSDQEFTPTISGVLAAFLITYVAFPALSGPLTFNYSITNFFGLKVELWKAVVISLMFFAISSVPPLLFLWTTTRLSFSEIRSSIYQLMVVRAFLDYLVTNFGGWLIWAWLGKMQLLSFTIMIIIFGIIFYSQVLPLARLANNGKFSKKVSFLFGFAAIIFSTYLSVTYSKVLGSAMHHDKKSCLESPVAEYRFGKEYCESLADFKIYPK